MRKGILLLSWIGLLHAGFALACDIENKREIEVGVRKGVTVECSNNGMSIQCLSDGEGADLNDGAKEQQQQELGNSQE